ncbi:glycosyltransferase [Crossiella sp. SN42]|nr:glycosyltransferase [Crossiella sp. SN42]
MRVLLAAMGSRGEVQPVVALALRLKEMGCGVRVCVSPDLCDWVAGWGIPAAPVGPRMRDRGWELSTPAGRRRAAEDAVAAQFAALPAAARDCDVVVGCGAVLVAARSVAELAGIGYVHAEFCPAALPNSRLAPAPWPGWPREAGEPDELWAADARRWNEVWGPVLNAHRVAAGLTPVLAVREHVLTERPLLAADPLLAPGGPAARQTGAWLLPDERALPADVESFIRAGEPPIYFGLGSYSGVDGADAGLAMVEAARAAGRRVIISRGWAGLAGPGGAADCLVIGEANHRVLFQQVAAVVHHGGAGTTSTAARAGAPQVVLPQHYDQHYWARRVEVLGIGAEAPDLRSLDLALGRALCPETASRAREVAAEVRADGVRKAAQLVLTRSAHVTPG